MDLQDFRCQAISQTLFHPVSLDEAFQQLGFVQADPIRSPARAQDLILRHRVESYRAGDLERNYHLLELDEDILYAYGFINRRLGELLYPRNTTELSEFEESVLDFVRFNGKTRPKTLESHFGSERVINDWGGFSKATKNALEKLHYRGLLRVCRREKGIRIYEAAKLQEEFPIEERVSKLISAVVNILAPVNERTLHEALAPLRRALRGQINTRQTLKNLIRAGELREQKLEGVTYILPVNNSPEREPPSVLRFLAPFDPLVWDRRRFEQLWGWAYRFEAYTPPAKRIRGFYAMPVLWKTDIVGWVNLSVNDKRLSVDLGFVSGKDTSARKFKSEYEREIERIKTFLRL